MEGFTKLPKMQCFKEGGSVQTKSMCYGGKMKEGGKADIAQDKAVVKKAFKMHDAQEHEGEKTDLSKLRKGGRAKKDCGTVKKYKAGGNVTNVYEAKKKSGDIDNIRKVKDIAPTKAAAPSKAATKPAFLGSDVAKEKSKPSGDTMPLIKSKESGKKAAAPSGAKGPDAYKKGGKIKKFAPGGSALMDAKLNAIEQQRNLEKMARAKKYLTGDQQGQLVGQSPAAAGLQQFGAQATQPEIRNMAPAMAPAAVNPMGDATGMPMQKRGGKVKKGC
jgi:hypothetical protein